MYRSDGEVTTKIMECRASVADISLRCNDTLKQAVESINFSIDCYEELLLLRKQIPHRAISWASLASKPKLLYVVECSCGEVTHYKVPLTTLDDFECPRKNRKEKSE